jgi:hypothetical protein
MHETVLRQIIGCREIATQLAKKIPHVRLVAAHQLTESRSIL